MEYESRPLDVDEGVFKYRTYGNGGKAGVVYFFHGFGDRVETFLSQINCLVLQGYECFGFDFPGCGENINIEMHPDRMLDVAEKIIRVNSHRAALLVGHSLGGLFALRLVGKLENMKNMEVVVIESTLIDCDLKFFKSINIKGNNPASEFAALLDSNSVPSCYLESYKNNLCSMSPSSFVLYVNDVCDNIVSYRKRIINMQQVIHYCFGSRSPCQSERQSLNDLRNFEIMRFEGVEHWVHIDAYNEFNGAITEIARKLSVKKF